MDEIILKAINWLVENIWKNQYLVNWLGALGTIGAVWVALWLARDKTNNEPVTISIIDSKERKENLTEYDFYKGEYIDVQNKYKITYEGSILLYNPSDFPKSLYDIKISVVYKETEMKDKVINDKGEEVKYITLKPKDLIVLNYNFYRQDCDHEDFPIASVIPYAMFFIGKTEEKNIIKKEIELKNKVKNLSVDNNAPS